MLWVHIHTEVIICMIKPSNLLQEVIPISHWSPSHVGSQRLMLISEKGQKKKPQQKKSSRQCSERDPLSGLYPLTDLGAEDNAASPPHCSEIPKLGKVKTHLNNLCMRVYLWTSLIQKMKHGRDREQLQQGTICNTKFLQLQISQSDDTYSTHAQSRYLSIWEK